MNFWLRKNNKNSAQKTQPRSVPFDELKLTKITKVINVSISLSKGKTRVSTVHGGF